MSEYKLNTRCVQGGYTPGNGEPRQIPIIQSDRKSTRLNSSHPK